jgi:hypothetical protein
MKPTAYVSAGRPIAQGGRLCIGRPFKASFLSLSSLTTYPRMYDTDALTNDDIGTALANIFGGQSVAIKRNKDPKYDRQEQA